jgi:hypothetical protein
VPKLKISYCYSNLLDYYEEGRRVYGGLGFVRRTKKDPKICQHNHTAC